MRARARDSADAQIHQLRTRAQTHKRTHADNQQRAAQASPDTIRGRLRWWPPPSSQSVTQRRHTHALSSGILA
ncbi:hypothetical protein B0I35DRAFT_427921 [Stachybotrys elegans]|uniref:Uncharacterized protein n=1 Tax=Stachybotrys elegans TaxID=80388 RepID=A0A8K0WRW9_9HYPO|nr:hypothetical protein B0I35DRAFT_427921 [Stachybotrys elegans]